MQKLDLNLDARKGVYRKFASTAIENSHVAIKQVWVALFTGGTFALINSAENLIECGQLLVAHSTDTKKLGEVCREPFYAWDIFWYASIFAPLFIIYLLTFYRFYVGNIRVFDMKYIEVGKYVSHLAEANEKLLAEEEKATFSAHKKDRLVDKKKKAAETIDQYYADFFSYIDKNARWESIYLIFLTLIVVSLTIAVNHPALFLATYVLLLAIDIIWIEFAQSKTSGNSFVQDFRELFVSSLKLSNLEEHTPGLAASMKMFPQTARGVWLWNNVGFALALVVVVALIYLDSIGTQENKWLYVLGAALAFLNCILDLVLAWRFYNPRFAQCYKLLPADAPSGDADPQSANLQHKL